MNTNEQEYVEIIPEPLVEPDFEYFVSKEEREYRRWKRSGGDIAFRIVDTILRHGLRGEISMSVIATTQLYRRSDSFERAALLFVCSESSDVPLSENDAEKLKLNDQLLVDCADHKLLGHRDFQNRIASISAWLEEKNRFDARTFPAFATKYKSPAIFDWILSHPY